MSSLTTEERTEERGKQFLKFLNDENYFMATNYLTNFGKDFLKDETVFTCLASEDKRISGHFALKTFARKRSRNNSVG